MSVKFTGINELQAKLKKNTDLSAVQRVVKQNGSELQRKAQRNAPVDTGTLKRSIGLEVQNGGMTAKSEAGADYAPYVEFGTRYMESQAFMKPAYNEQKEQFKRDLDKLVK